MSRDTSVSTQDNTRARRPAAGWWKWIAAAAALVGLALAVSAARPLAAGAGGLAEHRASGAGKTIIQGGTGGSAPTPVLTTLAFHANARGGDFECLALVPATSSGKAGSGDFDVNAMYVTGPVTSISVDGNTAKLTGTANVTGLGAGQNVPFTAWVTAGGPGTTVKLVVAGLTFHELLLEGNIDVS
jgi:hypothetical protein